MTTTKNQIEKKRKRQREKKMLSSNIRLLDNIDTAFFLLIYSLELIVSLNGNLTIKMETLAVFYCLCTKLMQKDNA